MLFSYLSTLDSTFIRNITNPEKLCFCRKNGFIGSDHDVVHAFTYKASDVQSQGSRFTMSAPRKVLVVIGLGTGESTGAAVARRFSQDGYSVALIARRPDIVKQLADELNAAGGDASPFPAESYSSQDIKALWTNIRSKYPAPGYVISAAVFNAAQGVWKPFLEVTPEDVRSSLETNVEAAFAFAREVILTFKENDIEEPAGKRGTLIFTGATASIRGNVVTSAFSAGKHGLRALSQSLAKEFGKQNIHVAHAIIDGSIRSERAFQRHPQLVGKPDASLTPESIANSYLYLVKQDRTAWTWELDLRPAHEKW
ncbi:hypothetical protein DXG01_004304 [Tephrocybe rancida]|nr:hypothetical protein DXG01_004304 [Tephrocybe rancida]